jgi:hypothetical protein
VTGDGQADILTAAGKGKSARAVSINGDTFQPEPGDFNPFADDPTGGGRGWYIDDIDVTLEPSFMVNGGKGEILLIPFDDPFNVTVVAPPQLAAYARPLRHGTTDVNGDGVLEIVLGTPKVKGRKPQACVLDPDNPAAIDVFFADPVLTFKGGVFVAGGR